MISDPVALQPVNGPKRILVVHPDDESRLALLARSLRARGHIVDSDLSAAGVRRRIADKAEYDFLVVNVSLAPSDSTSLADFGGVALARQFASKFSKIVIVSEPAQRTKVQVQIDGIKPQPIWYDYDAASICSFMEEMVLPRPPLDVVIFQLDSGEWRYEIHSESLSLPRPRQGPLSVNGEDIRRWKDKSDRFRTMPESWDVPFTELGDDLLAALYRRNDIFRRDLDEGLAVRNVSVRLAFAVSTRGHPLAFEAIFVPEGMKTTHRDAKGKSDEKFAKHWLIQTPVLRTTKVHSADRFDLFLNRPLGLNCLVLCADKGGRATIKVEDDEDIRTFDALPDATSECDNVRDILCAQLRDRVYRVDCLGGSAGKPLTRSNLEAKLKEASWDIVHFAGHTHFRPDATGGGMGYLILGDEGALEAVPLSKITPHLNEARLLYLSSCRSGSSREAVAGSNSGPGAVIGFTTKIRDTSAAFLARRFYEHLIEPAPLDEAFLGARRDMLREASHDPAWAAAILVLAR